LAGVKQKILITWVAHGWAGLGYNKPPMGWARL